MSTVVWKAFCGECDYLLNYGEANEEKCPKCEENNA